MLSRDRGSVAQWHFDGRLVRRLDGAALDQSLTVCAIVVSILRTEKLLLPDVVLLSRWIRAGEHDVAQSERVEKADVKVSIHPSESILNILPLCRSIIENESAYPLSIEISGSGVVATSQGDNVASDLVWLRATTLDIFSILVATQSDAWLPFSLKGEHQPDICTLNANRLATALQEIERQTGFKLEEGVESNYSVINGIHLDNIRYEDGSIADVS